MEMQYSFKQLSENDFNAIRKLFLNTFTQEPWYDDWSDEEQLRMYIHDLIGQSSSLTFGLYEEKELIALSMGRIIHGYEGTEYYIDELCVGKERQGKGIGTLFMTEIEKACREMGIKFIFLLTENNVPAFNFYKKLGFNELKNNVAFAKEL